MKRIIVIAGLTASLAGAPAALAQDSGYNSVQGLPSGPSNTSGSGGPVVAGAHATSPASGTAPASTSLAAAPSAATTSPVSVNGAELPFTGLDLAIVAAAGLVLLGGGLGLRRASRTTT